MLQFGNNAPRLRNAEYFLPAIKQKKLLIKLKCRRKKSVDQLVKKTNLEKPNKNKNWSKR